ncbi:hypothetical protein METBISCDRAFT_25630 [Metschnikowia bicuspidata]|uniref:Uncharacterized protein n=1 Tax=Metschnikowia bicuspidata TaxID=27322 RepID=A0A4V1J3K6_9ASCO|nr:hypothetical protein METBISCDRAFT_25630 [Metschnikowia bicuspidata]
MTKTTLLYEKGIYDSLACTYATLLSLKNDRHKYINSQQVYAIYDLFLKDLHELFIVRKDEELKGMTVSLPNLTDVLIDDVWQLLSLCFMTCGLTKFAPATYLSLTTVYKLLSHLKECQVFTIDDLRPIRARLDEISGIITNSDDQNADHAPSEGPNHRREETLLLRNKLAKCMQVYQELEDAFHRIPPDLNPVYAGLILVRKDILNYLSLQDKNPASSVAKINELKAVLKAIEDKRDSSGHFASSAPEEQLRVAQNILNNLLDDCHNLLNDLDIQNDNDISIKFKLLTLGDAASCDIFKGFKTSYEELISLKQTLDNLLVTRRWTMRETDLYNYQQALKRIEETRLQLNQDLGTVDPAAARKMKHAQLLVLYLLRRCYCVIYKLLESLEPVSESLQPLHNQLSTVRKCLLEIKRVDGLNNLRELYPFQFKLLSLDNLKQDGKFIVNGQVPEGQGTLNALLAECFEIIHELKIELDQKEESGEEDNIENDDTMRNGEITDEEDKGSDDEVELKRNRYMGFNEADYDIESENENDLSSFSKSEFESNDYY